MAKKQKRLNEKVSGVRDYIEIMNGGFNLTSSEIDMLAEIIKLCLIRKAAGHANWRKVKELPTRYKRAAGSHMGFNNKYSINQYMDRLKRKNALIDGETINPRLFPTGEAEVVIEIDWDIDWKLEFAPYDELRRGPQAHEVTASSG